MDMTQPPKESGRSIAESFAGGMLEYYVLNRVSAPERGVEIK